MSPKDFSPRVRFGKTFEVIDGEANDDSARVRPFQYGGPLMSPGKDGTTNAHIQVVQQDYQMLVPPSLRTDAELHSILPELADITRQIARISLGELKPGMQFEAVMPHYDEINSLWLCMTQQGEAIHFTELMKGFAEVLGKVARILKPSTEYMPKVGELVLASTRKNVVELSYRAVVAYVDGEKKEADVLFVDYGNIKTISLAQLSPCPISLLTKGFPFAAVRCKMDGVNFGFLPLFQEFRGDIKCCMSSAKQWYSTDWYSTGPVLYGQIVETNHFDGDFFTIKLNHNCYCKQNIVECIKGRGVNLGKQSPPGRFGEYLVTAGKSEVTLIGMESPDILYCWPENDESLSRERIRRLSASIGKTFNNDFGLGCTIPEAGYYVAIRWEEGYYRARVLAVNYDMTATVEFIDVYPGIVPVPFHLIRPLQPADLETPPVALKCIVHGFPKFLLDEEDVMKVARKLLFPSSKIRRTMKVLKVHRKGDGHTAEDFAEVKIEIEDGDRLSDYATAFRRGIPSLLFP